MLRTVPTTVLDLSFAAGLTQEAVYAQKIYWVTDTIQRANLDGSDIEAVVTLTAYKIWGLALDLADGKVYWTALLPDEAAVQRANLDGVKVGIPKWQGWAKGAKAKLDQMMAA